MNKFSNYLYIASVYILTSVNTVFSLLIINIFTLSQLGELTLLRNLQRSQEFSHLGFRSIIDRSAVYDENTYISKVVALNLILISGFAIASMLLAYFYFNYQVLDLVTFVLYGYFLSLVALIKSYYRAVGDTLRMFQYSFYSILLQILGQIVSSHYLGYKGFVIFTLVSSCFGASAYLSLLLRLTIFADLTKIFNENKFRGFKQYSASVIVFSTYLLDRILMNNFGGIEKLGQYSILLFFIALLQILPNATAELFYRKIALAHLGAQIPNRYKLFSALAVLAMMVSFFLSVLLFYDIFFSEFSYLKNSVMLSILLLMPFALMAILPHILNILDQQVIYLEAAIFSAIVFLGASFNRLFQGGDIIFEFTIYKILFLCSQIIYIFFRIFTIKRRLELFIPEKR